MMKKKLALFLVAALAVALCAVSFAACSSAGDVKGLYDRICEQSEKYAVTTNITAVKLNDLDGAEVSVSGDALLAEIEDPDTYDIVYELWVGGTKRVYRGEERPALISDWCWYVYDGQEDTVTVYTIDENVSDEFVYDGSYPYVEGDTLYVNGKAVCKYDAQTETVTELGEENRVPVLDQEGVKVELEDVIIEVFDFDNITNSVVKVYDKDGNALRLVNLNNLLNEQQIRFDDEDGAGEASMMIIPLAMTKKAIYLQELVVLPDDAKEYDLYADGYKYSVTQYKYDWKTGDLSEIDTGYIFVGMFSAETFVSSMGLDVFGVTATKVDENKMSGEQRMVVFDADMKVVCDLSEIVPGAIDIGLYGDYLFISDGTIDRYYDKEGNLVGEYLSSSEIGVDKSGLLVKGNDWFTVSGEYLFTFEAGAVLASVPGRLYYTEMNEIDLDAEYDEDASFGDFKAYDVASGTSTTICEIEKIVDVRRSGTGGIYIVTDGEGGYSVYNLTDGSELIDFETNDPTSVDFRNFGDDLLIEYTVTRRQGSVETDEMRYVLIDVEVEYPQLY